MTRAWQPLQVMPALQPGQASSLSCLSCLLRPLLVLVVLVLLAPAVPAGAQPAEDPLAGLDDIDVSEVGFDDELFDPEEKDPNERFNRATFQFNEAFYAVLIDPVGSGARGVIPTPVRRCFGNFFSNLSEPVIFVNDLLQLSPRNAMRSGGRFIFNTTFGMLGLFDAAERLGISRHESDFGQTLGIYRVASGPYVVLPLLGPSTARDTVGTVVDFAFRPDLWLLGVGPALALFGGDAWFTYDVERERLEALRETSVDFYSALRGAYLMDRVAAVEARREELGR